MPDEAFEDLVRTYHAPLYRFALSMTRNDPDANDLTQQTFFVWATKGHTLRDRAKVKTWLFTTLYREFLRNRRNQQRTAFLEDLPPGEQEPVEADASLVNRMDAPLVLAALQEIPPLHREPLMLFYIEDLSYLEIAHILDVPVGTVMSRLSRAKIQLRNALAQKAAEPRIIEFPQQGTGT
jgi:RNA polymerase sigma-70 factor (ECF subfamily)